MTTSGSAKKPQKAKGQRLVKLLVVVVVAGALIFGGYVGYLAWVNDSFPTQTRPFSEYASITSANFNGTEYAFNVQWLRADVVPLYAQITSSDTDAANSPVCDVVVNQTQAGGASFLPFAINQHLAVLTNVELSVAMKSVVNGSEFTIAYDVVNATANPGNIVPSAISCSQPAGFE